MQQLTTRKSDITEGEIHELLRNSRRRRVLKQLQERVGVVTVRALAEVIAELETGESPPPRRIRDSVYNSLHQTHLPKLDAYGVVDYDTDRKTVALRREVRQVDLYMEVVTKYGITWAEYYQRLLLLALLVILAAQLDVFAVGMLPTAIWASVFLVVLAVSSAAQLWSRRWFYLQQLVGDHR
jgi:hypothetical protein